MPAGRKLPTVTKNRNYPQPVKYLKPMALGQGVSRRNMHSYLSKAAPIPSEHGVNLFLDLFAGVAVTLGSE